MLGQVATLRAEVTDIASLHRQVTEDAAALLARAHRRMSADSKTVTETPVDIAIIGMASVLPKAESAAREYWENILDKVDAITEIPSHRWDWRLYLRCRPDTPRTRSIRKWGGFLDDMVFDPTRYGMPPKSIESVDPMQLMALEVAQRTLVDAGLRRPGFRSRAHLGHHRRERRCRRCRHAVRAARGAPALSTARLPKDVADRLPEWTEDTFAGILHQRHRGTHRQPPQPRRRELHHRRRLRLVARRHLSGRVASSCPDAAISSSRAASTPCKARSGTCASARRKRCRRAAAAPTFDAPATAS